MNKVDSFAIDELISSDNPYLIRIGKILRECEGSLTEEQTDEVAVLLKNHLKYIDNEYDRGYDKGWEDAREEFECDCY